jgi:membrane dipeptidase
MNCDKLFKLTDAQEERIRALYKSSVVLDCVDYSTNLPDLGHPEYIEEYGEAGVTVVNCTIQEPNGGLWDFLNQVSLWYQLAEETHSYVAQSVDDIRRAKEENKKCLIFGIQNGKPLEENVNFVRVFHKLGIRIIQLAYNDQNLLGAGGDEKDAGVTKLGRKMIEEMNRLGILIDASHCGPQTSMDAINYSSRPIAFTHANPKALCDHYRNKTDEQLKALASRGGVVGLTAYSPISRTQKDKRPTLKDFLDFVDYVVTLIGVEHVGFGLDHSPSVRWDREGYYLWAEKNPGLAAQNIDEISIEGLEKPADIFNMSRGLVSRGYSDVEIKGILGENFLRLFGQVW